MKKLKIISENKERNNFLLVKKVSCINIKLEHFEKVSYMN